MARVLVKGEPIAPPAGRSDDFKWPRRAIAPFGKDPVVATTTDPIPVMQAAPAATTVPVPRGESRAVAATGSKRTTGRAPSQNRRNSGRFPGIPFVRNRPIEPAARHYRGSRVVPIRNLSIAWAHWRPSRIAQTTSDWPRRMSPAANTFGSEV